MNVRMRAQYIRNHAARSKTADNEERKLCLDYANTIEATLDPVKHTPDLIERLTKLKDSHLRGAHDLALSQEERGRHRAIVEEFKDLIDRVNTTINTPRPAMKIIGRARPPACGVIGT